MTRSLKSLRPEELPKALAITSQLLGSLAQEPGTVVDHASMMVVLDHVAGILLAVRNKDLG